MVDAGGQVGYESEMLRMFDGLAAPVDISILTMYLGIMLLIFQGRSAVSVLLKLTLPNPSPPPL